VIVINKTLKPLFWPVSPLISQARPMNFASLRGFLARQNEHEHTYCTVGQARKNVMPFFASFDNLDGLWVLLAALLYLLFVAALALIALILAFSPRTRPASMWCAFACMVTSVPLALAHVYFFIKGGGFGLLQVSFFLAPMFVSVAVLLFDLCFLRKDRKLDSPPTLPL
jgi:hypothetical protein